MDVEDELEFCEQPTSKRSTIKSRIRIVDYMPCSLNRSIKFARAQKMSVPLPIKRCPLLYSVLIPASPLIHLHCTIDHQDEHSHGGNPCTGDYSGRLCLFNGDPYECPDEY